MTFHAKFVGRKYHPLQCRLLSFESLAAMLPVAATDSNTKTSSRCSSETAGKVTLPKSINLAPERRPKPKKEAHLNQAHELLVSGSFFFFLGGGSQATCGSDAIKCYRKVFFLVFGVVKKFDFLGFKLKSWMDIYIYNILIYVFLFSYVCIYIYIQNGGLRGFWKLWLSVWLASFFSQLACWMICDRESSGT